MPVVYTSRVSFISIIDNLKGLQEEVYLAIESWKPESHGPGPSIEDLAETLGRKESSMSGRVNELLKLDAIMEGPMKLNKTQKTAKTYRAIAYKPDQYEPDYGKQLKLL